MTKLTAAEIEQALTETPEWSEVNGEIQRTFEFADFRGSIRFVNAIADAAEAAQHHPDIIIRYSRVTLSLSTHDAGGITRKDFDLALKADAAAGA
jgi:4a-hydroxytetrahydrobiopterin dehydratase